MGWWSKGGGGPARAVAALLLLATLGGCDPEQMSAAPPGSPPSPAPARATSWLGATLFAAEFNPTPASLGASTGARLDLVVDDGPAQRAGLREGDIVVQFDGRPVATLADFTARIAASAPGTEVKIAVLRDGQRHETAAVLERRPADADQRNRNSVLARLAAAEQASADAERAGDYGAALRHAMAAFRFARLDRAREETADDRLLARMAALLPRVPALPPVPPDADRLNRRALAMLQTAASEEDNERAYRPLHDAVYEAPWIADLWLNGGLVLEKAGYPETAKVYLRRYAMLNPADAPSLAQKLAELDVQIEDRRPWTPYVNTYPFTDKRQEEISLRGRNFILRSVTGSAAQSDRRDKAGDVIAFGTVRNGARFPAKWIRRASDPDAIRCFGAEVEEDAEIAISAERQLTITVLNSPRYLRSSCEITGREPIQVRSFPAPK